MNRFETRKPHDAAPSYEVRLAGRNSPIEGPGDVLVRNLGRADARFLCDTLNRRTDLSLVHIRAMLDGLDGFDLAWFIAEAAGRIVPTPVAA